MRIIALVGLLLVSSIAGFAQRAAPAPAFEVASIKLNSGTTRIMGQPFQPSGRYAQTITVALLLAMAYPTMSRELVGAPGWVTQDRYDIVATAGREAKRAEMIEMIRALLIDRFQLQAHIEMREEPVFNLVVAREDGRLGPDIQPSTFDCDEIQKLRAAGGTPPRAANGTPACTTGGSTTGAGNQVTAMTFRSGGTAIAGLASILQLPAGRIVFDRTGLTGLFEYTLTYATTLAQAREDVPSVFTAVQEQLGMRLVPATAPVTVLVVDRIERPTEN
jgi:uncharacterized protein (TIGR03435 family)